MKGVMSYDTSRSGRKNSSKESGLVNSTIEKEAYTSDTIRIWIKSGVPPW